jgi:hypothetical protein
MAHAALTLDLVPGIYAVVRLPPDAETPAWASGAPFVSVTRTHSEVSIICEERTVPPELTAERGFRCLCVLGPLEFSEVGILASLATPLALAGVSIFAMSTYETDYLLVRSTDLELAITALSAKGHRIGRVSAA